VRGLNMTDPLSRLLSRMILGSARQVAADAEGRLALPAELADFAGLSGAVVMIGQGDYLEIWSPEAWEAQETQLKDIEANAARFSMLTVSTH
jgi:MraZ protein